MQLALDLAFKAYGKTSPNPMVGAVIVKDGEIIGQGYHQKAGTFHAEIHALNEAGEKAKGATMYVTLEPCCHKGRTGPCTEAVIKAGIKKVYIAMLDPNPLVAGKGVARLNEAGILTEVGLLEDKAQKLNEIFITYMTKGRPFVLLKVAMSLDGKIATKTGDSRFITGEMARNYVHQLRNSFKAILVGINTVLKDDPALTTRLFNQESKDPIRIILDSEAKTPLEARILNQASNSSTIIVVSKKAPLEKINQLENKGAKIIHQKNNDGKIDLRALLKELKIMEIDSILVEGGGQVHASFLEDRLADKILWFIAPKIIGGKMAPSPVSGEGIDLLKEAVNLERLSLDFFGEDIGIKAYLKNPQGLK